jgi:predicted hotdog family 3-hydroxylacyl-ACP dehydratase
MLGIKASNPKMNKISGFSLEDILPHRGDMLLLENVIVVEETFAVTDTRVSERWPMAERHGVSPLIMVELAAQSAGVCNGLARIKKQGRDSSAKGWLVGVKKARFFVDDFLCLGGRLTIRSENRHEFDMLREVYCEVRLNGGVIGEITLQLIQAE